MQNAYGDQTWTNLTANANGQIAGFVDWDWGMQGCHKNGCQGLGIEDTTIFATMYAKAGDWDVAWDPDVHFVVSNDWFKTMKKRIACGNQFELLGRQVGPGTGAEVSRDSVQGRPVTTPCCSDAAAAVSLVLGPLVERADGLT